MKDIPSSKCNIHESRFCSLIGVHSNEELTPILTVISKGYFGTKNGPNYHPNNLPIIDLHTSVLPNILGLLVFNFGPRETFNDTKHRVSRWFIKGGSNLPIKYQYKLLQSVCVDASYLDVSTRSRRSLYFNDWFHQTNPGNLIF